MMSKVTELASAEAETGNATPQEIESGKSLALIGYIFAPIAILPFLKRDNAFTLYHAKQALAMLIVAIALSIGLTIAGFLLAMVKLGFVLTVGSLAFSIAMLALIVLGAMAAWNGQMKPLPIVGGLAKSMFGGVQKA